MHKGNTMDRKELFDNESVICLDPIDDDGIRMTQLEFNIHTQRREQLTKTDVITVNHLQLVIHKETELLRNILDRHGTESVSDHSFVIHLKGIIHALCLDLIQNYPSNETFWNQYEDLCLELSLGFEQERKKVFVQILAKEQPEEVYVNMAYCEHNLSGNYERARELLALGIEKQESVDVYVKKLMLEVGECYCKRCEFAPDQTLSDADKDILFGNHLNETFDVITTKFDLKERHILEIVDKLVHSACHEYPCYPVMQLREKYHRALKATGAVAELVALKAEMHLDGIVQKKANNSLLRVFQIYWTSFLKNDRDAKIWHRAIGTFAALNLDSSKVRKFLYLVLDVGLFHNCLTTEHIRLYYKQLALENSEAAEEKTRIILNQTYQLADSADAWRLSLINVLKLSRTKEAKLVRLKKVSECAFNALGGTKPKELPALFGSVLLQMSTDLGDGVCEVLKWLEEFSKKFPIVRGKFRAMLIVWYLNNGRPKEAKTLYVESRCTPQPHSFQSELLGELFLQRSVKMEPVEKDCKAAICP